MCQQCSCWSCSWTGRNNISHADQTRVCIICQPPANKLVEPKQLLRSPVQSSEYSTNPVVRHCFADFTWNSCPATDTAAAVKHAHCKLQPLTDIGTDHTADNLVNVYLTYLLVGWLVGWLVGGWVGGWVCRFIRLLVRSFARSLARLLAFSLFYYIFFIIDRIFILIFLRGFLRVSPRLVAQCRQFQEDASVSECTWTLSALEALRNALYKFKTYLLTYLLTFINWLVWII